MYAYIYDEFTNQSKYNKILHKIEKRLTDLGINGTVVKLGISKKMETSVLDQIRRGGKTIVAVGDDQTISRVLNVILSNDNYFNLTLGIIPVSGKNNYLADILGIKNIEDACNILLARRIKKFKLSKINNNYFLFKVAINNSASLLEIDKNYAIKNSEMAEIIVSNLSNNIEDTDCDSLSLSIKTKRDKSLFCFKDLLIVNNDANIIIDNSLPIQSPARIKACFKELKIIVGKNRNLNN